MGSEMCIRDSAETDPTQKAYRVQSISGEPGEVNQGFHTPEVVELVDVPEDHKTFSILDKTSDICGGMIKPQPQ